MRSRQKLRSLSNKFTFVTRSSRSCVLRHFNFEREQSAPSLPPFYLVLGIATVNASCAEDEDSSFSGNKETVPYHPQIAIFRPFDEKLAQHAYWLLLSSTSKTSLRKNFRNAWHYFLSVLHSENYFIVLLSCLAVVVRMRQM